MNAESLLNHSNDTIIQYEAQYWNYNFIAQLSYINNLFLTTVVNFAEAEAEKQKETDKTDADKTNDPVPLISHTNLPSEANKNINMVTIIGFLATYFSLIGFFIYFGLLIFFNNVIYLYVLIKKIQLK